MRSELDCTIYELNDLAENVSRALRDESSFHRSTMRAIYSYAKDRLIHACQILCDLQNSIGG